MNHKHRSIVLPLLLLIFAVPQDSLRVPPAVGVKAPEFALKNFEGKQVKLSERTAESDVVLVVLRGYPGYQCPLCNIQVRDLIKNSEKFSAAGTRLVMVYPGPIENLQTRAAEFLADKSLPAGFDFLLDPGYEFTERYMLRWNAPSETSYPSTFLIGKDGVVYFAKVSKTHGGRTTAAEILEAVARRRAA